MRRLFLTPFTLAALAVPAASIAADNIGPYVGVGLGVARVEGDAQEVANSIGAPNLTTLEVTSGTARLYGGYRLDKHFGIEAHYGTLGNYEARVTLLAPNSGSITAEVDAKAFGLTANGYLPITGDTSLMAKGGIALWDVKSTGSGFGVTVSASDTGWTPLLGAGVITNLTQNLRLRAEIEYFNKIGKESTTGDSRVILVGVGLELGF
jgi:OmpA-OmpF porin, OOP family